MTCVALVAAAPGAAAADDARAARGAAVSGSGYDTRGELLACDGEPRMPGTGAVDARESAALRGQARGRDAVQRRARVLYDADEKAFARVGEPTEAALKVLAEKIGVPKADEPPARAANGADPADDDEEPDRRRGSRDAARRRCERASRHWADRYERLATLEFSRDRKSMSVLCRPRERVAESGAHNVPRQGARDNDDAARRARARARRRRAARATRATRARARARATPPANRFFSPPRRRAARPFPRQGAPESVLRRCTHVRAADGEAVPPTRARARIEARFSTWRAGRCARSRSRRATPTRCPPSSRGGAARTRTGPSRPPRSPTRAATPRSRAGSRCAASRASRTPRGPRSPRRSCAAPRRACA